MLAHFTPKMLIIPLGTIVGTLLFSALASLLLSQWSVFDCMAVGVVLLTILCLPF